MRRRPIANADNPFTACHDLLARADAGEVVPSQGEASDLLHALGYLRDSRPTTDDRRVADNRLALLVLAARLDSLFTLPNRHAPTACFVGAEVAPRRFGLTAGAATGVSGKGASLRGAFESCLGEAAEYLALQDWGDAAVFTATVPEIRDRVSHDGGDRGAAALDWMLAGLGLDPAGVPEDLPWLWADGLGGGPRRPVPLDLCIRRAGASRPAESGGLAAGATAEAACYAALMELIERDAVALWWLGGRPPRGLAFDPAAAPDLAAWVAVLREAGGRPHWLLDLTGDLGIPVVAALSSAEDGAAVVTGFAADLDPQVAARGALLEMCQMELAQDLVDAKRARRGDEGLNAVDRQHLARRRTLHRDRCPQLTAASPGSADLAPRPIADPERLPQALAAVRTGGFEALCVDLTRPELAVPTMRVLVPGLQSATSDRVTPRLRRVAAENAMGEEAWRALPPIM